MAVATAAIVVTLTLAILLAPPPRIPSRSETINVQASDLGEGWAPGTASHASGNRSWVEFSSVYFERQSPSGGRVYLGASVFVYRDNVTATAVFANDTKADGTPIAIPFELGDGAVCVEVAPAFSSYAYISLEFHVKEVVVTLYVSVTGAWEDLSGRPFTAAYHLADDTFLLARVLARRI